MPKVNPMACIINIRDAITPTAPEALVPMRLTKKVSAILYTAVTSILIMVGTASLGISLETGVSIIILYLCSWVMGCLMVLFLFSVLCLPFLSCQTGVLAGLYSVKTLSQSFAGG